VFDLLALPDGLEVTLRIALIMVAAVVAFLFVRTAVNVSVRHLIERRTAESGEGILPPAELERRVKTVARLVVRVAGSVVAIIATLMVLDLFEIDIGPAIAGLGVIGIAVGLGAQTLVKDWLAGIFIVLENQYSEGDVVRIAGVDGVVEAFSLRRTTLRDLDGTVHTVPNGQITVASNMTRLWSRVNLDVGVAFDSDIDRATALIDRVGEELQADEEWGPRLLEAPAVVRVDAVAGSVVTLKVLGQVRAAEQWAVAGELRKRILAAFAREGIDMPLPHQVIVTRGPAAAGTSAEDAPAEAPAPDADPTKPVGPAR
jgi:small-conductance mechanosensitive channel